jgi:hypothetical protein
MRSDILAFGEVKKFALNAICGQPVEGVGVRFQGEHFQMTVKKLENSVRPHMQQLESQGGFLLHQPMR